MNSIAGAVKFNSKKVDKPYKKKSCSSSLGKKPYRKKSL